MARKPLDPTVPPAKTGELVAREADHNERRDVIVAQYGDGLPWHADHYEHEIRNELRRGCDAFLRAGRLLLVAKHCAGHGEWGGMLERLSIAPRQAQRMMEAARRIAALPNASRATHLIEAAGTQGKLIELLSLPDEEFSELANEGATGQLTVDDVASMTRDELRAAVRDAKADIEAKDARAGERERRIEHLEKELRKARGERQRATPAQEESRLRDRAQTAVLQCRADISARGEDVASLAAAIDDLRAHAAEQGNAMAHDAYLGGLVGEVLAELRRVRDEIGLPIVGDYGDPNWSVGA